MRVYGWALLSNDNDGNQIVATTEEHGREFVTLEDLQHAVREFGLGPITWEHDDDMSEIGRVVESMVVTPDKLAALGIPDGIMPQGAWWIGAEIPNACEQYFAEAEAEGFRLAFSIEFLRWPTVTSNAERLRPKIDAVTITTAPPACPGAFVLLREFDSPIVAAATERARLKAQAHALARAVDEVAAPHEPDFAAIDEADECAQVFDLSDDQAVADFVALMEVDTDEGEIA